MKNLEVFKKAVASGLMITIGSAVFLATDSKVAGAVFFSVGLFAICSFGMNLYTGKIGYFVGDRDKLFYLIVWLGNLVGCIVGSGAVRIARPQLVEKAQAMAEAKLAMPWYSVIILGFFCGILMYAAVHNFKKHPGEISGVFGVVFCVAAFILAGFEHSIADMCYLVVAFSGAQDLLPFLGFILLVTLGNSLGAIALRWFTD